MSGDHQHERQHGQHRHGQDATEPPPDYFEPEGWEDRYAGPANRTWSGKPNVQLVAEVTGLTPGTALDVGCGEGGDVVWLAQQGWRVTGADFSAAGLARAAHHAAEAGVADRVEWWQVDARTFAAGGREFDLVTTHFLHPPDGGMVAVTRRLAEAVAPGGHLLVVGHAPSESLQISDAHRRAMWVATDLVEALPDELEVVVAEQRHRPTVHDGVTLHVDDSTLLARRRA
jgi:SAM-dependent methyltransferase